MIRELDQTSSVSSQAELSRKTLARLAGILKVHLAMEDQVLYPQMLQNEDPGVRATALEYQTTMGELSPKFNAFYTKWNQRNAMEMDYEGFRAEWAIISHALNARMSLEDKNLYDLVDQKLLLTA